MAPIDVLRDVIEWHERGLGAALATVVDVERSAPLGPGAAMAVGADGAVVGSVSGGCVEPAVVEAATETLSNGLRQRLTYGIADEQAFEVGLTCGGTIHLFVEPIDDAAVGVLRALQQHLEQDRAVAVATVLEGERQGRKVLVDPDSIIGTTGDAGLDHAIRVDTQGMLELAETGLRFYGSHGERRPDDVPVFVQSFARKPEMYIFGAIDFAAAVVRVGSFLGYRVTVCDARARFATEKRFPDADEVVVAWPHEFLEQAPVGSRTAICILTHDPKFDVPALKTALATPAGYIGAMGSRRTHAKRIERLREEGVGEDAIARISGPIGLDIGARTPEEVAVSIAAEIISLRHQRSGKRLVATSGSLHE